MKPPKRTYIFTVTDGKIKIGGRKEFDLDILAYEGHKGILTTEWLSKKRSLPQNAYYHGVVVPYVTQGLIDVGNEVTNDLTHNFLKGRFLANGKDIIIPSTGEQIKGESTTTTLTTTEMMAYIDQIIKFAAEYLNTVIPDPDPLWNLNQE